MRKRLVRALGVAFLVQAVLFVVGQASPALAARPLVVCDGSIPAGTTVIGDVTVPSGKFCSIDGTVTGNVYAQPASIGPPN